MPRNMVKRRWLFDDRGLRWASCSIACTCHCLRSVRFSALQVQGESRMPCITRPTSIRIPAQILRFLYVSASVTINTVDSKTSAALGITARAARTMTCANSATVRGSRYPFIAMSSLTGDGNARGGSTGTRRITSWKRCCRCRL